MVPLWKQQINQVARVGVAHRRHLLVAECVGRAKGPGADPIKLADLCAPWKTHLNLQIIAPTDLVRKFGKSSGALAELISALGGRTMNKLRTAPVFWEKRAGAAQALSSVWPQIAVFDITGAINNGIKIIAALGPLLRHVRIKDAQLIALDAKVVPQGDLSQVGQILANGRTPEGVAAAVSRSQTAFADAWSSLLESADTMERARLELGLPEEIR